MHSKNNKHLSNFNVYFSIMDYVTAILLGVVSVLAFSNLISKARSRYPSGPFAFPFIGNLPQLAKSGCFATFAKNYQRKYGNVSQNFLTGCGFSFTALYELLTVIYNNWIFSLIPSFDEIITAS